MSFYWSPLENFFEKKSVTTNLKTPKIPCVRTVSQLSRWRHLVCWFVCRYLVGKFGSKKETECLYPEDPARRGYIDTLIDLEHGTVAPLVFDYVSTFLSPSDTAEKAYNLKHLEKYMNVSTWTFYINYSYIIIKIPIGIKIWNKVRTY